MAARSIGSLTVSFGLVVDSGEALHGHANRASAISFNLLHKTCGSRLKQQYLCQKDGVPVERDEMVKGYEFAKDQYVRLHSRRDQGARGSRHAQRRHHRVRAPRVDRPGVLRQDLLPGARQGRAPSLTTLFTARVARVQSLRLGRWAARGKQYIVMIRARSTMGWSCSSCCTRTRCARSRTSTSRRRRSSRYGAQAGPAADRAAILRYFRPRRLHGRRARAHRSGDPEEGGRPGDHSGGCARGRRAGDRPDGSAARQPRAQGCRAFEGTRGEGRAAGATRGGGAQAAEAGAGRRGCAGGARARQEIAQVETHPAVRCSATA